MRFFYLTLFSLFLTGCSMTNETHIKRSELVALLQAHKAPLIIDVRSSIEYKAGHVPTAIHIPFWQSFSSDALDNADKDKDIILYCEHGPRAGIAKFAYYLAGFTKIRYLEGHMMTWRAENRPMEVQ